MRTLWPLVAALALAVPLTAVADDADPFAEGATWTGHRKMAGKNKDSHKWGLRVTERKKDGSFKGDITIHHDEGDKQTYTVAGKAPLKGDGAVSFKTDRQGFFRQSYVGKLTNGAVALTFTGTGRQGKAVAGTASLKPTN